MIGDLLPDWLTEIAPASLRDALRDARIARRECLRDGAATRAPDLVKAGDTLLLYAERLIEYGRRGRRVSRKVLSARERYERARHAALDVSDGKCPRCRRRLARIEEEIVLGPREREVIIRRPALRCGPCGMIYNELAVHSVSRDDHKVAVWLRQVRWARADQEDHDDLDDGEHLWIESGAAVVGEEREAPERAVLDGRPMQADASPDDP